MVIPKKFLFLQSVRFWKLVVIAILIGLQEEGVIENGLLNALMNIVEITLGGSIVIRTVDRTAEYLGENKK